MKGEHEDPPEALEKKSGGMIWIWLVPLLALGGTGLDL